tara:strand:+ start:219 stop:560 length:342 start_codon:yes stop_codon:yes gene_type:complete
MNNYLAKTIKLETEKSTKEEVVQEIQLAAAKAVKEAEAELRKSYDFGEEQSIGYMYYSGAKSITSGAETIEGHLKYLYNKVKFLEIALSEQTKLIETYKKEIEKLNRRLQEKN